MSLTYNQLYNRCGYGSGFQTTCRYLNFADNKRSMTASNSGFVCHKLMPKAKAKADEEAKIAIQGGTAYRLHNLTILGSAACVGCKGYLPLVHLEQGYDVKSSS